jgi:hypothetical protein
VAKRSEFLIPAYEQTWMLAYETADEVGVVAFGQGEHGRLFVDTPELECGVIGSADKAFVVDCMHAIHTLLSGLEEQLCLVTQLP